jgi:hypothetical protein
MIIEYQYILPGIPVNANQCNKINRREWSDQAAELELKKHILLNQHNEQPLFLGPIRINTYFYFPEKRKQKHAHYLTKPNTLFNLIRFIQKVTEGTIIAPNAYVHSFESHIGYSYEPRTVLIIEKEIGR